jgi:membrane fusion protein, multidrug efflux system
MPDPRHSANSGNPQVSTPNPTPANAATASAPANSGHAPANPPASRRPIVIGAAAVVVFLLIAAYFIVPDLYSERTDDAYVEAHLTTVTAKVPAYVQTLHVDDNAKITAGELLVELDPRDYVVQVDVARANLAAAEGKRKESDNRVAIADADAAQTRAELEVARANAVLAAANLQRLRSVSDARAVSNERLDTGQAAADGTRAALTAAQTKVRSALASADLARTGVTTATASVAQAQAALDQAQLNLSYTKIAAVQAGTIANKTVEEGNYVQPGQMLLAIVPLNPYVIANFKETQLERIQPGQAATVRVDAYPRLRLKGHVDSLQRGTGSVFALLPPENATGNFVKVVQRIPVKIILDDPEAFKWISPGMSVEASIRVAR